MFFEAMFPSQWGIFNNVERNYACSLRIQLPYAGVQGLIVVTFDFSCEGLICAPLPPLLF